MKCGFITDTHYGARKGSQIFHDYFEKFYSEVFFPTLDEQGIDTVVHMGDVFDNRKNIDFWSLNWAKRVVFDPLQERNIKTYLIVGNHDAYYKNTNNINSLQSLLREYNNLHLIYECEEKKIGDLKVLFIPWICSDNKEQTLDTIRSTDAKIGVGHLELNGFYAYRGHKQQGAHMEADIFSNFSKVFSGHYHTRSDDGKVYYLGNPYEIYWNDVDDPRGFHIFDTETLEMEPVNNPFKMFHKIYYDDTEINSFDFTIYESKIVKLIVNKRSNLKKFEMFIDKLYQSGIHELKIVDMFDISDVSSDDEDVEKSEDTLTILNEYVDLSGDEYDKSKIKNMIQDIYKSAFVVV